MHLCLDYQPAVAQRAGIGRYTRLLAEHLSRCLMPEDRLRLFYLDFFRRAEVPVLPGVESSPWRMLPGAVLQQFWKRGLWPRFDMIAGRAELYHFTNFIIPPLSDRALAVASVFDMSFMRFPHCAEERNLAYMRARIGKTLSRANAVVTISQFSADEICEFFPDASEKVFAIPLGLDQTLVAPSSVKVNETRKRLGISKPYILSVGTLEPRKNYQFLIEAFERLGRKDVELVIAGMRGWRCEPVLDKMANSPFAGQIRYLEYVADADLAALYAGAEVFALASLYEGFGFPPLEAMLCGTPVVSSAGGSLPEVLGDAADIVREFDADLWAESLGKMLDDNERRTEFRKRGFKRAKLYNWEDTARRTYQVYLKTLAGETG